MFKITLMIYQGHWRTIGIFESKELGFPTKDFIEQVLDKFPHLEFRIKYKPK